MDPESITIYRELLSVDVKVYFDCKFLVGEKDVQEVIPAHKAVLALKSPVFRTMFYGNVPEEEDSIKVPDIHPEIFHEMIGFFYNKTPTIVSIGQAIKLWYVADKYDIKDLVEDVTNYLTNNMTPQNVCYIMQFTILHRNVILLKECQEIILKEISVLLNDKSLLEPALHFNLTKNTVNLPEMNLFKALAGYYNARHYNDAAKSVEPPSMTPLKSVSVDLAEKEASVADRKSINPYGEGSSSQEDAGAQGYVEANADNLLKDLVKKIRVLLITSFISLISDDVTDM